MKKNFRWILCWLLFLATALCFLDRQVLSVLAPQICEAFEMTKEDYSDVTNMFLLAYAVMFLLGGWVIDRVGTRWGLGLSVALWSVASAAHAVITSPFQLGAARFVLGMGEGGCFPGAAKAVAEWFPKHERALATGIAIGGASLGGVAAPPLTVWLTNLYGWQGAFLATGIIGALWVSCWFLLYYHPERSPWVSEAEREYCTKSDVQPDFNEESIQVPSFIRVSSLRKQVNEVSLGESASIPDGSPRHVVPPPSQREAFNFRGVVGLSLARFLFDPVFYLYMFWIPKYLHDARGVSFEEIGWLSGLPFLALGVSNILGGFVSDFMVKRGSSVLGARKKVMTAAALLTMASAVAAFAPNAVTAIAFMSVLMFAHGFWITNFIALVSDNFPKNRVATVVGISGLVGTIGGLIGNKAIGFVSEHISYVPVWIASGLLYPAALIVILISFRQTKKAD